METAIAMADVEEKVGYKVERKPVQNATWRMLQIRSRLVQKQWARK
jgi:hypothetical protein